MPEPASELILAVLTRIPLPPGPITLFKALYESSAPISISELAALIRDGDEKSLHGVLSALRNRVNNTAGLEGDKPGYEFLTDRDETRNGVFLQMRPEVRAIIDQLPELRNIMGRPTAEIHSMFERKSSWPVLQASD